MISNNRIIIILVLVIVAAFSACHKHNNTSVSSSAQSNVALPADWPIPQLQFSDNIVITNTYPKHIMNRSDGARIEGWEARVHCESKMAGVSAQVEKCIAPLGYLAEVNNPRSPKTELWMREYISRDGFIRIIITSDPSRNGKASFSEITSTDPADKENCTDYSIIIFKSVTIDPILDNKLNGEDSGLWQLIPLR